MLKYLKLICLLSLTIPTFAQDDLLKMLQDSNKTNKASEPVSATFKGTRVISAHTTEMLSRRNLDFRVAHRFGTVGDQNGYHSLFGLDNSSDIRIAFEYGLTDDITLGFSRSKQLESYEGFIKYRLLKQTTNNKIPVSLGLVVNTVVAGVDSRYNTEYAKGVHRFSYFYEAIIARKVNSYLSLEILPALLHRNYVNDPADKNDLFTIGAGGRLRFSRSSAIVADYYYVFSDIRQNSPTYFMPLAIGYEVETGGHVFSLMFTNAEYIVENNFLPNTSTSWFKNFGFRFSFNISRIFKI